VCGGSPTAIDPAASRTTGAAPTEDADIYLDQLLESAAAPLQPPLLHAAVEALLQLLSR
jgi:hypothetical protein